MRSRRESVKGVVRRKGSSRELATCHELNSVTYIHTRGGEETRSPTEGGTEWPDLFCPPAEKSETEDLCLCMNVSLTTNASVGCQSATSRGSKWPQMAYKVL